MTDVIPSSKYRSISGDIDENENLQLSLRGRTFLGFRVVLGTLEITSKDLIAQCLDAPDGMRIVVQALSTFLILIIVIVS